MKITAIDKPSKITISFKRGISIFMAYWNWAFLRLIQFSGGENNWIF